MPMPKKMPWSNRLGLAWAILRGKYNVVNQIQTSLLEEMKLRNRNKQWYTNLDAGKYPYMEED